jgi:hypothetical protein
MRRAVIASAFILLLTAVTAAQAATTITSPKAGETWLLKSAKTITWTGGGSGTGRLALYRTSTGRVGFIKSGVSLAAGSQAWTVGVLEGGEAVPAAKDYFVRLVSGDGTLLDKSDVFAIDAIDLGLLRKATPKVDLGTAVRVLGSIAVSSPANGASFKPGNWIKLAWSKAGIESYPSVVIGVYLPDGTTFVGSVGSSANTATSWPNSGTYDAPVFNERYQVGKQYCLRVATPDEKHVGFSGVFTIAALQAVPVTEEVYGLAIYHLDFTKSDSSSFPGCFYSKGTAGPTVPDFTHPVGVYNVFDDPDGPCWTVTGHLYRTVAKFETLTKGWEVTKAELRFVPEQGTKQTISVNVREDGSDSLGAPLTGVASLPAWGFGQTVSVDVTAAVQAWCSGQKANNGFVIAGEEAAWGNHNNAHIVTFVGLPKLVVTHNNYQ